MRGLDERGEDALVEAFVAQSAVKTLDERVLYVVGRDGVPLDAWLGRFHAAAAASPIVWRRLADPVLAAKIFGLRPALCSFRISMTCSSLICLRFMFILPERNQLYHLRVSGQ